MAKTDGSWFSDWIDPDTLDTNLMLPLVSENLANLLEGRRNEFPSKDALICLSDDQAGRGQRLAYEQLVGDIFRTARALKNLGQGAGGAVMFLGLPTTEGLTGFWGAQIYGSVFPANPMLSESVLQRLARTVPVDLVVTTTAAIAPEIHEKAKAVADNIGVPLLVLDAQLPGENSLAALSRDQSSDAPDGPLPGPNDIVAYFPTGGTTGLPKIARLTQRNQIVGLIATAMLHDPAASIVTANGLPMFHVGGGIIATTRALALGQTLVQLSPIGFRASRLMASFWDVSRRIGINQLIAVPTVFSDLIDIWSGDETSIRYFIAGASKLPASLNQRYEEAFGLGIHEGYGMTECSGFATGNLVGVPPRAGSAGKPAPFYAVNIAELGEYGIIERWCGPGDRGRVVIRGPAVFAGYCDDERTREKFLTDSSGLQWLDSGDVGSFDEDGYLWLTGRDKDIIIRGGHNIDASCIEAVLLAHPDVTAAAAVGLPDPRVGELPIAYVSVTPNSMVDEASLVSFARETSDELGSAPVRVIIVDPMPFTAMNKIFKPELRRRALQLAIAPYVSARLASNLVEVTLDENGDLVVITAAEFSDDLVDLSAFLSKISVKEDKRPNDPEGIQHAKP